MQLGVIPIAGYKPLAPTDTFTIYDSALATVETTTGVVILRDPRDIEMYLELFSKLAKYAAFDGEARALLAAWSTPQQPTAHTRPWGMDQAVSPAPARAMGKHGKPTSTRSEKVPTEYTEDGRTKKDDYTQTVTD